MSFMKALPHDPYDSSLALTQRSDVFRLTVAGLVSRTQQFSLQDLRLNFNEWSSTSRHGDRLSSHDSSSWSGCSLNELIEFVGVSGQAHYIEFVFSESKTGEVFSVPVTELEDLEIGLVWERNGESLSAEEGGPLLVLVPGMDGYQPLPGVSRINLVIIPCSTSRRGPGPALAA
jgi:DMSO/TMAO reductase YedYZ molybdopterin-dependent catalytic subunit